MNILYIYMNHITSLCITAIAASQVSSDIDSDDRNMKLLKICHQDIDDLVQETDERKLQQQAV